MVDRMRVNQSLTGQIGTGIGELVGIPFAIPEDFTAAVEARRSGRPERAVERASPTFMNNILSSVRLRTEGQTTLSGRPVNLPEEKGPRKIGPGEAMAKGIGFQPVNSSKAKDLRRSLGEIKIYWNQKREELANRCIEATRKGRCEGDGADP